MPIIVQLGLLFQHKNSIRNSIAESFDKEDMILFEFTHQEIKKLDWEHEREFKYQGNMYDVVEQEQHGNKHLLWCYKDDKEKKLKEKITHFLAFGFDDDVQKNDSQKKLSNFYNGLYYQLNKQELIYFPFETQTLFLDSFNLLKTYFPPSYPPPKSI